MISGYVSQSMYDVGTYWWMANDRLSGWVSAEEGKGQGGSDMTQHSTAGPVTT